MFGVKTVLITGRMGVGKTELLSLLQQKSYPVFSADKEAQKLLQPESPCYQELTKLFPDPDLYQKGAAFYTKKLAQFVFQNPERRKSLEQVIHPRVRHSFEECVKKEREKKSLVFFYEAALLSKEILKSCDFSLLVISSYEKQKQRLIKMGWSQEEIKVRLESQLSEDQVINEVDFVIENNKDKKNLEKELNLFLDKLEKKE